MAVVPWIVVGAVLAVNVLRAPDGLRLVVFLAAAFVSGLTLGRAEWWERRRRNK